MYKNIKNLVITGISHSDIYRFAVRSSAKATELLGNNPVITPVVSEVSHGVEKVEAIFTRNLKHPLTREINIKNAERKDLLTSLRRDICSAQKRTRNVEMVMTARDLKQEMKDRGWWKYHFKNYSDLSTVICTLVEMMAVPPLIQWVETLGIQEILDEVKISQEEFDALVNNRLGLKGSDTTLQMRVAKKQLIHVVSHFLSTIDFGLETEPDVFREFGEYINEFIGVINAKTRMRKAHAENGVNETNDEETESEGTDNEVPEDGVTESEGESGPDTEVEPETEPEAEEVTEFQSFKPIGDGDVSGESAYV